MNDNERIQARVLSEEEIMHIATFAKLAINASDAREAATARLFIDIITTIRDRDKTIAELQEERDDYKAILEEINDGSRSPQYIASCILGRWRHRQALTVSKHGVTTDSEDVGEQPEKHELGREAQTDMQWRGDNT